MAAKLIVHNPQRAILKTSGYKGEPTGSIELTENHKTYNVKEYAEAVTNIPDPVLIEKTVAKNGTYSASLDHVDGYDKVTVALPFDDQEVTPSTIQQTVAPREGYEALKRVVVKPTPLDDLTVIPSTAQQTITPQDPAIGFNKVIVEGYTPPPEVDRKDVNFIDYDGTILYSFTLSEIQNLAELPSLPSKEGYTYQGWNWSLENIKNFGAPCVVGALRKPSDCNIKIVLNYIKYDDLSVSWDIQYKNGTIIVNWGDGQSDTYSRSSTSYGTISLQHTYQEANDYVVKISFSGDGDISLKQSINHIRATHIDIGEKVVLNRECCGKYAKTISLAEGVTNGSGSNNIFSYFETLEAIVLPRSFYTTDGMLNSCKALQVACLSDQQARIRANCFTSCNNINMFSLNPSVTTINDKALSGNYPYIFLPSTLMSIGAQSFPSSLIIVDMSDYSDPSSIPTLSNSNAFTPSQNTVFYVKNQSMLDAFSSATNWSSYATKFQIKT